MDGIGRSRGWDKEIQHDILPMEQLVLSDNWARIGQSSTCDTSKLDLIEFLIILCLQVSLQTV